jgi:hypothetical protein
MWMRVGAALVAGGLMMIGCSGEDSPPPPPPPPDAAPDAASDGPVDVPMAPDSAAADRAPDVTADGAADQAADLVPDSQWGDLPPPAAFVLTPESHDFQTVPVGMSRTHIFELQNTGGQYSGTPSISLMGGPEDVFRIIDNQCETALEPESRCTVEVQFTPAAPGAVGALLEAEASPGGKVSSQLDGMGQ